MKRFSKAVVKELVEARLIGKSYKQIAKEFNVSSASVLKYTSNIVLSSDQKQKLKLNEYHNRQKFASIFASAKEIKKPLLNENFASILGHLFFDGSVSPQKERYVIRYINASNELVEDFNKKIILAFALFPAKQSPRNGINCIWYQTNFYSKELCLFLQTYSWSLSTSNDVGVPIQIMNSSEKVKAAFLRAFWDDEGCISAKGYLSGSSVSEKMIDDLIKMHDDLGVESSKQVSACIKLFTIYVYRNPGNFQIFVQKIGFSKSRVSRGKNLGKFKSVVLSDLMP